VTPAKIVLLVALLALVNLPVVSSLLADRQVATEGRDVVAEVVSAQSQGDAYVVFLGFDGEYAEEQPESGWPRRVDAATYEAAERDGTLEVTAVPGEPNAFRVPGEVGSSTGLWMTALGNVLIAGWVLVTVRRTRRRAAAVDPDEGHDADGPPRPV
jgi:hypothetical protein